MSFLHCPNCGVAPGDTERSSTTDACPACGASVRQSLFRSSLPYRRFGRSKDGRSERDGPDPTRAPWRDGTAGAVGTGSQRPPPA